MQCETNTIHMIRKKSMFRVEITKTTVKLPTSDVITGITCGFSCILNEATKKNLVINHQHKTHKY